MSGELLVFLVSLEAEPERVFAALTEARQLERWFCDVCESEPRANGRLVMRWTRASSSREDFVARWVQFEPLVRAAWQGGHSGYPNADAGTVWFALTAHSGATQVQVRHELPDSRAYDAMVEPWRSAWTRALARLQAHLAPVRRADA